MYLGNKKLSCGYFGDKKLSNTFFNDKEVCGDDGKVHFPNAHKYYIQAFISTGRRTGLTKVLQFNYFALRHEDGTYPIEKYHKETNRLDYYLDHYFTSPTTGKITYGSETAESGYRDESIEQFDLYDNSSGVKKYIATGHFKDWHTTGGYQKCTWSKINEFLPAKKSRYFRMEIFTAKAFSDVRKIYFPKMWFEDVNYRKVEMRGNDAHSSPQDSGSSVDILFDGHPDTYYNSRNSLHPIFICFETYDGSEVALKQIGIMGKNASEQTPATFRINACDSSYNPLWEVCMVKQPVHALGFAWREWDTRVWPAKMTLDYKV